MRIIVAVLAGIVVIFIGFLGVRGSKPDLDEQQPMLVMRWIGHQVLLKSGDKSSRVLPVIQISAGVYQLEFQNDFGFMPDTLVKLIHRSLTSSKLPLKYTVNVFRCASNTIVYGYRFGADKATTLVPCLGREQPKGCYVVQIAFQDSAMTKTTIALSGLAAMAAIAFGFIVYRKTKTAVIHSPADVIPLGVFSFSATRRLLFVGTKMISLTDKEARLLEVLSLHRNEPLDRDHLLKKVWVEDGVIVGRSLDVFISKLRKKLAADANIRIVNIHGKGYKLEIDPG